MKTILMTSILSLLSLNAHAMILICQPQQVRVSEATVVSSFGTGCESNQRIVVGDRALCLQANETSAKIEEGRPYQVCGSFSPDGQAFQIDRAIDARLR